MIEWKEVELKPRTSRNAPFISIGRGGIDVNAVACDLVGDTGQYTHAKLLKAGEMIGIQFLTKEDVNAIMIRRKSKTKNGKQIKGITFRNKEAILRVFGSVGIKDSTSRFAVKKDPDHENILIVTDFKRK